MIHNYCLRKFCHAIPLAGLVVILVAGAAAAESLQQAWNIALAVDHGLKASRKNSSSAASLVEAAKSAHLPTVTLEANYTALDNMPEFKAELLGQSLQMPMAQRESGAYRVFATLPLYTGGRIERSIDAATSALEASQSSELGVTQNLKLRVAMGYVTVLRAERALMLIESHVTSLEAHTKSVEKFYEQGAVAKNDLLSARVTLTAARQQALQATNGQELARAAYNRLLGRPLDQTVLLDKISPLIEDKQLSALTERALAQRSELVAMARQLQAMRHQISAVRGKNAPQVALGGGYVYQQNRYQAHEGQWLVTLGLKWNMFNGGGVSHRAKAVEHQATALEEQREELISVIVLQVRQAWLDVQETRKRISVTESAIAQAAENLRVSRDRYANGLSTHTSVLAAETMLVNSETNHANAIFDATMAGLRLKHSCSEL